MRPEGRLFLDCEFDGWGGRLISLALAQGGEGDARPAFYGVVDGPAPQDPWVQEHVMPVLGRAPESLASFQTRLWRYLSRFDSVHIIADYPDDFAYFCRALVTGPGVVLQLPPLTMELDQRRNSQASRVPHNALCDAWAIAVS